MSEEQLKAFIAKVQVDASLQEQLKGEGADVVAIAKAAGFSIAIIDIVAIARAAGFTIATDVGICHFILYCPIRL